MNFQFNILELKIHQKIFCFFVCSYPKYDLGLLAMYLLPCKVVFKTELKLLKSQFLGQK